MIREISLEEKPMLLDFIKRDNARNYFIRLGLEGKKEVFEKIYGEFDEEGKLKAALFKRLSGNLQFFAEQKENFEDEVVFDVKGFSEIIRALDFEYLISPASYCDKFSGMGLFQSEREGAFLARLKWREGPLKKLEADGALRRISEKDLKEIVELYKEVFNSFSSDEVMRQKLLTRRGRGFAICQEGKILSVAQSEFESDSSAVIVGVATLKNYEKRGFATKCLEALVSELIEEEKDLYLQFDNPKAGEIYKRLGFKDFDRVKHYKKSK